MRAEVHRRHVRRVIARATKASLENLEQRTMLAATLDTPSVPDLISECDTGVSNADGITSYNNGTGSKLQFDVSGAKANADVQILLAGTNTILGSATADSSGTARVTLNKYGVYADGAYNFVARQELGGNMSAESAATAVVVDTTAPATPVVALDPASDSGISNSDSLTNITTPTVVLSDLSDSYRLFLDGTLVASGASVSNWTAPSLTDGVHQFRLETIDLAGNISPSSSTAITISTAAPAALVAPDLDPSADSGLSNTDDITKLSDLLLNISASPYYRLYENGFQISADYETSATFLRTLTTEGTHSYTVRAVDAAGNLSPESTAIQVTYDKTAPLSQAPLLAQGSDTGISSTDWVTKINTPTITTVGNSAYQLYVDSVLVGTYSAGQMATLSPLSNGTHTFAMYAMDVAGNLAVGMSHSITIDTIAPTNATLSLRSGDDSGISNTDGVTTMTTPTFLLSSTNYFILQKDGVDLFSTYTYASSYRVNYLYEGTYAFTARLSDVAGNTIATNAVTVTVDTTAPVAPVAPDLDSASDSGSSNTDNITKDNTPTLLLPGGGDRYRGLRGGSVVTSWITGTNVTLGMQSDGTFAYTLQAMDAAGNISSASPALSITIDTLAPTVPLPSLTAASDSGISSTDRITNVQNPVLNITALMGLGDVTLLLDGSPITVDWSNPFLQVYAVTEGVHTVTAERTDLAGNLYSANVSFTIDFTAPAAPPAPDLQAGSDNGESSTDNYTSIQSPIFNVSASPYFVFVHDGAQVGGNYLTGSSYALSKIGAGTHSVAVHSRDAAGNVSVPSPGLIYTIFAAPPALAAGCDSGSSGTDGVTNYNNVPGKELQFAIRGTAPGDTLRLYIDDVLAGTGTASDTIGFVNLSPGVLADGTHTFTASRTPSGGNEVMLGDGTLVIDTVAPTAPGIPDLLPAYDTGVSDSDNVTNNPAPKIHVNSTEGTVTLRAGVNSVPVVNGEATLPFLYRGANVVGAYAQDLAGNVSYSPTLSITYDAFAPLKPSAPTVNSASGDQLVLNLSPAASVATVWSIEWAPSTVNFTDWSRQLVEWDINTGKELRVTAIDAPDWWSGNIGVAAANGEVYVAFGSGPWAPGYNQLYVYDATTLQLLRAVTCGVSDSYGFAFANGKLYSSNGTTIREIDPLTGAAGPAKPITLGGQPVSVQRGLTGTTDTGKLLATAGNRVVYEIDPETGWVMRTITLSGAVGDTASLSYRSGEIVALGLKPSGVTDNGSYIVRFSAYSGARLGYAQCYASMGTDLGGDGFAPVRPAEYYRVYRDGVLISDDYVSASNFADTSPLPGTHAYTVTAVDAAGNESAVSEGLVFPVLPPAAPYLEPGADSGSSNTDGVTMYNNDNGPGVYLSFRVAATSAGDIVRVYIDGVLAGSAVATGASTSVRLNPGAVANGTHVVRATRTVSSFESQPSEPGTLTVDTVAPDAPAIPDLLPEYDSGISSSDNITNVGNAALRITYDGAYAQIYYVAGNLLTTTTDQVTLPEWIPQGRNVITARAFDLAGNQSSLSQPLVMTFDTFGPLKPSQPVVDGSSGTNPVLNLSPAAPVESVWIKTMISQTPGSPDTMNMAITEIDAATGLILRTIPLDAPDWWQMGNISIATGDGQVYVGMGISGDWGPSFNHLYVFDAGTGELVRSVHCNVFGFPSLGFVNGKLYALTSQGIREIDPVTGEGGAVTPVTLNGTTPYITGGLTGTGGRGTLIVGGGGTTFYELDAASGIISRTIMLTQVTGEQQGLAYRDGELIVSGLVPTGVSTWGNYSRFDLATGNWLGTFGAPWWVGGDIGGDGMPVGHPVDYYRVIRDGVQISEDYVSTPYFVDTNPPLDGNTHSYAVRAFDAAGNGSLYSDVLWYPTPTPPAAPHLDPGSDTGVSNTDGLTNLSTSLVFTVQGLQPHDTVRIYIDGVYAGLGYAASGDSTSVATNLTFADGTHSVQATRSSRAGIESPMSAAGTFTVDTVGPATAPSMPDLLPQSDSGISDTDDLTNALNPRIHVDSPDGTVKVSFIGNSFSADEDGNVSLPFLIPGLNPIFAYTVDAAGNQSPYSPVLVVKYDPGAPLKPSAPVLDPNSGSQPVLDLSPAAPVATGWSVIWAPVPGTTNEFRRALMEWDIDSGKMLRSAPIDAVDWWSFNIGVAAGNGEVYVAFGSGPWGPGFNQLHVYDATTLELKRSVYCGVSDSTGFAFLNGKLYSSNGWSIAEINPLTGAAGPAVPVTLNGQPVNLQQGLTGAPDRGTVFATPGGKTVYEIDPVTGVVVNSITLAGVIGDSPWLSYRSGEIVTMGQLPDDLYFTNFPSYIIRFDAASGARLGWAGGAAYVQAYNDLGGDGYAPTRPEEYYRVYRDGVQISDDYVSGPSFTDESPLTGTHIYTVFAVDAAGNLSPASDAFVICPTSLLPTWPP